MLKQSDRLIGIHYIILSTPNLPIIKKIMLFRGWNMFILTSQPGWHTISGKKCAEPFSLPHTRTSQELVFEKTLLNSFVAHKTMPLPVPLSFQLSSWNQDQIFKTRHSQSKQCVAAVHIATKLFALWNLAVFPGNGFHFTM